MLYGGSFLCRRDLRATCQGCTPNRHQLPPLKLGHVRARSPQSAVRGAGGVWPRPLLGTHRAAVEVSSPAGDSEGRGRPVKGWSFSGLLGWWRNPLSRGRDAEFPVSLLAVGWRSLPAPRSHLRSLSRDALCLSICLT